MRKRHEDLADDVDGLVGPPEADVLGTVGRTFSREEAIVAPRVQAQLVAPRVRLYCSRCGARLVCCACGDYYRNCKGPCACGDVAACPDCDLEAVEIRDRCGTVVGVLQGVVESASPRRKVLALPRKAGGAA
ncbi:hypothetical protein SAMN02745121_08726 [Nannocystis exedens]|uniref:Uncharacterized protein n=1 Tax=Nannocystis exedens TaxID=54 RepID=A0A1I2IJ60_9BACT|nr:hypothetical protein [Nannocystis exedens]PCC73120.1 hypothetical protein NAEX_06208 [Nannocystis exedens]SFF41688.1 hypothetical protein SAMN02745121_08726 [Nannocystis exedens]